MEVHLKLDRDRMIQAREMLGYGIEKTAEEAGVSKNSVLRAEHEQEIRPITARKIAAALRVPVAHLSGGRHIQVMIYDQVSIEDEVHHRLYRAFEAIIRELVELDRPDDAAQVAQVRDEVLAT
jgi:DNA-binding XRE family transcriptional regulator